MPNRFSLIGLLAALVLSQSVPTIAAGGVKIDDLIVASTISDGQRGETLKSVRAFYEFSNTVGGGLITQDRQLVRV